MKFLKEYSAEDQKSLKTEVCPKATEDQINYYLRVCESRKVDPFSGLCYLRLNFIKSENRIKCSVPYSIDGQRAKAASTGSYAGSDMPEYDSEDKDLPVWCIVTVYRMINGTRVPFTAKCRYKEFKPAGGQDFQWKADGKPYHMLAKVTEGQALRKAFPDVIAEEDDSETEELMASYAAIPDAVKLKSKEDEEAEQKAKAMLKVDWNNALRSFDAIGVSKEVVMETIEVTSDDEVTKEHLESLREIYTSLKKQKAEAVEIEHGRSEPESAPVGQ
jgi:phage recombination protein Bet